MADAIRHLSPVDIDGTLEVSGKIRGLQATEPGDAIMLGEDGKVPSELVDIGTVDLSDYYTKEETDSLLDAKADSSEIATIVEDILAGGDGTGTAPAPGEAEVSYTRVQRLTVTGNGSSTSLSASHSLGAVPAVTVYDPSGQVYLTDTVATATQITLNFTTAPASGTSYTLVVIG